MESGDIVDRRGRSQDVVAGLLAFIALPNILFLGGSGHDGFFSTRLSSQTPQATFRTGIDIVQLDVSALDKGRVPVTGLQQHEFVVYENGRSRPIVGFEEIRIPSLRRTGEAPWVREAGHETATNILPEGRLLVLVLDDATVPPDVWTIRNSKRIGHAIVDRLGPDDLLAVVFTRDNRHAVNFTADRARLRRAIQTFSPGFNFLGRGDQYYDWSSAKTLREVVQHLSTQARRRKAVIYVSVGVMYDRPGLAALGLGGVLSDVTAASALDDAFRLMLTSALQANVTVYPIDPAGLAGLEFYLLGRSQGRSPEAARAGAAARLQFLRSVARETGGRAVIDTNDVNPGIEQIFTETGHYYFLAYQAAEPLTDGRYRRVRVAVTRPGVEVFGREGFFAPQAAPAPLRGRETTEDEALTRVMAGLLPRSELPMRVAMAPLGQPESDRGLVVVALDLDPPVTGSMDVGQRIEIEGRVFTVEGDPVQALVDGKRTRFWRQVVTPLELAGSISVSVLTSFEIAPGRYEVRVSAARGRAAGSVHAQLEVPNFRTEPLTLSGVFLTVGDNRRANAAGIQAMVPVDATARRAFDPTEDVTASVRVFQGARAPLTSIGLHTTVVDTRGGVVLSDSETLDAQRFDVTSRSAQRRFKVPVATLQSGAYLLSFEVVSGSRTARRDVRFTVR